MVVKKKTFLSALASVGFVASSSAGTLLVDFGGLDNGGILASTSADFQGQDAAVDLGAAVNVINADVNNAGSGTILGVTGIDVTADVQILNGSSGFNANTGAPTSNVPILDGYVVLSNGTGASFGVTNLDGIAAGTEVLLTVYAVGDQDVQVGEVGFTLGTAPEVLLAGGNTSIAGTVNGDDPLVAPVIGTDTFRQVSFTKVAGVDSFEIRIDRDSRFSAINGFSLTFENAVVPEPASMALIGLGSLAMLGRRRRA